MSIQERFASELREYHIPIGGNSAGSGSPALLLIRKGIEKQGGFVETNEK